MSLENEGVEVSALGLKGAGDEATRTEEWSRSGSGDRGPKTAAEAEGHGGGTEEGEYVYQQSIPIPANKVAWIIGKHGSYVKQLQQKSGATIVVSTTTSKEYGRVWRYVQITGTGRALDRAKKLLHIRLERLEAEDMGEGAGVRL